MKRNQTILDMFRHAHNCEWCGRQTPEGCDPAHIISRGAGGPDHPLNLIALCRGWHEGDFTSCHVRTHQGLEPTASQLFQIVAMREGWKCGEDVRLAVWKMIRERTK
jgi:hypothetical protein